MEGWREESEREGGKRGDGRTEGGEEGWRDSECKRYVSDKFYKRVSKDETCSDCVCVGSILQCQHCSTVYIPTPTHQSPFYSATLTMVATSGQR